MARRRIRRRNPARTTGALIINPRRRRSRKVARRTNRRTRRNVVRVNRRRRTARRNPVRVNRRRVSRRKAPRVTYRRVNRRRRARRNPVRVNRRRSRRVSHRRNPVRVNARRRGRKGARRGSKRGLYARFLSMLGIKRSRVARRRKGARKNPRRHSRRAMTRHNPAGGFVGGLVRTVQGFVHKIPVIGGILADVVGFGTPAIFGALTTEPTMLAAKYLGKYVPWLRSSLFYGLMGLVMAAGIKRFFPGSPATKHTLAVAAAAAAGGIAWYKFRSGQDGTMESETAGLLGDFQYAVRPYGDLAGIYGCAGPMDAWMSDFDFAPGELGVAKMGPAAWKQAFPKPPFWQRMGGGGQGQPSWAAGKPGHRWGWLIKLIGQDRFTALAHLPQEQRVAYIRQLKEYAIGQANALAPVPAGTAPMGESAGYSAVIVGM